MKSTVGSRQSGITVPSQSRQFQSPIGVALRGDSRGSQSNGLNAAVRFAATLRRRRVAYSRTQQDQVSQVAGDGE